MVRVLLVLGAMLRVGRSAAPKKVFVVRISRRVVGSVGVLAVVPLVVLATAPSVLAAGPPQWLGLGPGEPIVHSTRVILTMTLRSEKLATKWKAEVAPMECGGSIPTEGWKIVDEEEISAESAQVNTVRFGTVDAGDLRATAPDQLRHLEPATCYDARFTATNADSSLNTKGEPEPAVALVPFKTLPIEKPEIAHGGEKEQEPPLFELNEVTDVGVAMSAKIETNGAAAKYSFEYSLPENGHAPSSGSGLWKVFSSGGTGTVTVPEDYGKVTASTTGLSPETTYYVRLRLSNEKGTVFQTGYTVGVEELENFTTGTAKPGAPSVVARNITGASAHLSGGVFPHGSETMWRFQWALAESGGFCPSAASNAWADVPGGEGVINHAQAEATPYSDLVPVGVTLRGLSASTRYCARLSATNGFGGAESDVTSFDTEGPPDVSTFSVHRLVGESVELLGTLNPKGVPTSEEQSIAVGGATGGTFTLTFSGHTTAPIPYNAPATGTNSVESALRQLAGAPLMEVQGVDGGPYTVLLDAETAEPLIEADGTGLTPAPPTSSVAVARVQKGGESNSTEYWFQYVTDKSFEEHGWSSPEETSHAGGGFGSTPHLVGLVVSGLKPGEGYRFRLIAESTLSGGSPTVGEERALAVPATPVVGEHPACPNEAFRTGLSAHLPDCRAYEQITPLEKGAAQEPFHYRGGIQSAFLVGEDGEHAVLEAPEVSYGSATDSGQSPYLFSRGESSHGEGAWSMLAGAPQPETGISSVTPQVYSADLTQVAFESAYSPSGLSESPEVEYKVGRIGGPYRKVASVPRKKVHEAEEGVERERSGWVAANGNLSKLVLQTNDYELLGIETGTHSGSDLYEYTTKDGLRQLNVKGSGPEAVTIGSCGAKVVDGVEDPESAHRVSSTHSVSVDGSRVFFEAVPGRGCSEPKHLYMRVNGAETVDIGAYTFSTADVEGKRLVLKNGAGEVVGYNTDTKAFESQPSELLVEESELSFLGVPVRLEPDASDTFARPRYTYWVPPPGIGGQASRYDNVEHLVECVSCSSSFDPEPKHDAFLGDVEGLPDMNGGLPGFTAISANGDFAFFTTVSALVPQDLDEEIRPEFNGDSGEYINVGGHTSPSTDVYEWRAAGVDGCALVQGCLALITNGRGGYLNLFLGTANEGRDVFFSTRSTLSPADNGTEGSIGEGNIYDARIGGRPASRPSRPSECEGDACSTPPSPPVDSTPSSFTFTGTGNVVSAPSKSPGVKKKKVKKKAKRKARKKAKKKRTGGKTKRKGVSRSGVKR